MGAVFTGTATVRIAVALCAAAALSGCVGGGAVLPSAETTLEDLYREAYGGEPPVAVSGPMDVRMQAFCERFSRTLRRGGRLRGRVTLRVRECLATAAAEGLLSGYLEQRECEGLGCSERITVEERWPPPLHPGWSGSAVSGLDAVFPRLPNPDVLVYVYPHVATPLGVGVPGYVTAMPMFPRPEYALPGERVSTVPPAEWPAWEADDVDVEPFVASPRRNPGARAVPFDDAPVDGEAGGASAGGVFVPEVTALVGDALERGAAMAEAVSGLVGEDAADQVSETDAAAPDQVPTPGER